MEELPGRVPEETPVWCQAQELMEPAAEPSWSGILASLPFTSAFSLLSSGRDPSRVLAAQAAFPKRPVLSPCLPSSPVNTRDDVGHRNWA